MFNSEKLFSKFSNQRALIFQSVAGHHDRFNYDEIIEASKIVKNALRELIHNDNNNIGVLFDHSAEIVPVILGILDSCSTFCCLNQNLSQAELNEMIDLLQCNIGIADKSCMLKHSLEYETLKEINIFNKRLIVLRLSGKEYAIGNNSLCDQIDEKDIFLSSKPMFRCSTSGTTGKPKLVQVPFKCLMPNVFSLSNHYTVTQSDVIYISSPPTFDPFVVDLLLGLLNGATILMVSNEIRLSKLLASSLEENSVTIMQITPSLFRRFSIDAIKNRLLSSTSALRCLILGGEPFPCVEEVALWFRVNGEIRMHTRLFNIYGITEVSCWATIYELTPMDINCKDFMIPIGEPLDQYTNLKVVDCVSKEIIENGIGELFIETKIRQCVHSENGHENVLLGSTATGDLVEIKSGTIYYKTRVNNMVKIFGRKVNLTKIENTIKSNWPVNDACCVYDKDKNSLILFVQCGNGRKYTTREMFQRLRQILLQQEIPNAIYFIDDFPLSCHGKISKSKLLEMIGKPSNHRDYFITKLEENLLGWDVEATVKLSFLAAGGNSVLALQLVNELETKFNLTDPELITMLLSADIRIEEILLRLEDYRSDNATKIASESASTVSYVWSHDLEKCIDASPTNCAIDNQNIVSVGSHSHILVNIDLASGQLLSRLNLPSRIECQVVQFEHYGIVGCYDGFVYCFDIRNGREKWKFNSNGMVKSRVCIMDKFVVFGNYNSEYNLWCLRADDGAFIWHRKIGNKSIYAGIVRTTHNKLFVSTLDGVCAIVDPFTGKSLWETRLQSPIFSTATISGNNILVAEVMGIVHCIDQCFGKIRFSFKANGNIYSSFESISENSICFGCYDKSVYCISFDASLFTLLWKVETTGQIFSSARSFVFDSMNLILVCSTDGTMSILNSNGESVKQFRIDGEIFSTPSVVDNKVVIASRNNLLYCFDLNEILK